MTRRTLRARLEAAEARRADFDRTHIKSEDVGYMLRAVLEVVGEEAGLDVGAACGRRLVEDKVARVHRLLAGPNARQLADVGQWAGLDLPDPRRLTVEDLTRLFFIKGDTMTQGLKQRVKALEEKATPHPKNVYLSVLLAYVGAARAGRQDPTKAQEAHRLRGRLEELAAQLGGQP